MLPCKPCLKNSEGRKLADSEGVRHSFKINEAKGGGRGAKGQFAEAWRRKVRGGELSFPAHDEYEE